MTLQTVTPAGMDLRVFKMSRRILKQNGHLGNCMLHGQDQELADIFTVKGPHLACVVCMAEHFPEVKDAVRPSSKGILCQEPGCFLESEGLKCTWCDRYMCNAHLDGEACCAECDKDLASMQ